MCNGCCTANNESGNEHTMKHFYNWQNLRRLAIIMQLKFQHTTKIIWLPKRRLGRSCPTPIPESKTKPAAKNCLQQELNLFSLGYRNSKRRRSVAWLVIFAFTDMEQDELSSVVQVRRVTTATEAPSLVLRKWKLIVFVIDMGLFWIWKHGHSLGFEVFVSC